MCSLCYVSHAIVRWAPSLVKGQRHLSQIPLLLCPSLLLDFTMPHPPSEYEPIPSADGEKDGLALRSPDDIQLIATQRKRLGIVSGLLALSAMINVVITGMYWATTFSGDSFSIGSSQWVRWRGTKPVWCTHLRPQHPHSCPN